MKIILDKNVKLPIQAGETEVVFNSSDGESRITMTVQVPVVHEEAFASIVDLNPHMKLYDIEHDEMFKEYSEKMRRDFMVVPYRLTIKMNVDVRKT